MRKTRIVLFGVGALSKFLTEHIREEAEIVAYLLAQAGGEVNGKPVISFEQLEETEFDYVVVAFGNTPRGVELLKKANVPENKIVGYAYSGLSYAESILQKKCSEFAGEILYNDRISELFYLPGKKYFLCGMNVQEKSEVIERDYVREQTLAFLAEEIERKNIEGSVAEIGVSQGTFAKKINFLFPKRICYLFDTYEGLPDQDKQRALQLGWGERQYALSEEGTSIEKVLAIMPHRDQCVVKKGCFPDTFDVDGKFAFVSLDVDFYDTVKKGLEIIYPRLSKGGYIMVHDYHNLSYTETKDAVMDFCEENQVAYVPIPDAGGTVVIVK